MSGFLFAAGILLFQKLSEFVHERADILELPVNRRETYISDRVEAVDTFDHEFSDLGAGDLLLLAVKNLFLDLIHDALDLVDADRALVAGPQDPALDFRAVIWLSVIVLFDDDHGNRLYFLIGRKPAFACITDSAPPDGVVLLDRS